jgi:hypothetical protein
LFRRIIGSRLSKVVWGTLDGNFSMF